MIKISHHKWRQVREGGKSCSLPVSECRLSVLGEFGGNILLSGLAMCVCLVVVLCATCVNAADDFSRYQVIIDRKPFGEPPPDLAPAVSNAAAAAQAEQFFKSLKMVAIKIEDGNTWVGLVNQAAGNKGYYLGVGDKTADGIELVEASFIDETALLRKDGQEARLYMGGSQPKKAGSSAAFPKSGSFVGVPKLSQERGLHSAFMRNRMEEMRKEVEAQMAEKPKFTGQALDKHLNDLQMKALREGLPPLPVPLTKEMDDQLVSEGVLPALQAPTSGR